MSDNASVEAQTSDPLKTVADAMEHAVKAAREGASDARAKVDQARPGGEPIRFAVRIHGMLYDFLRGGVPDHPGRPLGSQGQPDCARARRWCSRGRGHGGGNEETEARDLVSPSPRPRLAIPEPSIHGPS